jgi:2-hydroxychromene-2-carboxylate isomerase
MSTFVPPASSPALDFWFDFGSTYSYLSAMRIETLARDAGIRLRWRPFLLGPIFQKLGWTTSPFNLQPAKGRYMWRDMARLCAEAELTLRRPSTFPRVALLAARVGVLAAEEAWCRDFVRAVFRANFAEDRDVADEAVIGAVLASLGQPAAGLIERAKSSENKLRLRAETEEAERLGVFGAPSFVTGGELFWGNDRLEQALDWARRAAQ